MSKFGSHITIGPRNLFGAALQQCANAHSPVPLIFALDQNVWDDVVKYSPSTFIIFRTQPDGHDNPPGIYSGDPIVVAEEWYAACKPKWLLNKARWYAPLNEANPAMIAMRQALAQAKARGVEISQADRVRMMADAIKTPMTANQHQWLDRFLLEMIELAYADDLYLAVPGCSTGTPEPNDWTYYAASLQALKETGGILIVHEYGLHYGTLQASAPHGLALRYRSYHQVIEGMGIHDLPMAITEASADAGYFGQGTAWLDDAIWYDGELMQNPYVIGFCAYQLGGAENWQSLIPQWADYVATHPTPDVPPPSDEWVFDRYELEDGTVIQRGNPALDFDLTSDRHIIAVYEKKAPPVETFTFQLSVRPAECAPRVSASPAPGEYPQGTFISVRAT